MTTSTRSGGIASVAVSWIVAGVLTGGAAAQAASPFDDAKCWWKLDAASSGAVTPATQIIDSRNGINGTAIQENPGGAPDMSWTALPGRMPSGGMTDGRGLNMVQVERIALPTSNNALYQVAGDMTAYARLKLNDYTNSNGQGVYFFSTFRWVSGPPNTSQGFSLSVYAPAGSLQGRAGITWGSTTTGYVTTDANQYVPPEARINPGEWVDVFWTLDSAATTTANIYLIKESGVYTNTYTHPQNLAAGDYTLAAVTGGYNAAIGGQSGNAFNGILEQVAVWDRVLTMNEILAISTPEPASLVLLAGPALLVLSRRRRA